MTIVPYIEFGCAVCFGDPTSLSSKAVGAAVILLVAVVGMVLFGIGWTAYQCSRRERLQ